MVGRLLSLWDGNFSGAMLNFGGVPRMMFFFLMYLRLQIWLYSHFGALQPPLVFGWCALDQVLGQNLTFECHLKDPQVVLMIFGYVYPKSWGVELCVFFTLKLLCIIYIYT